MRVNFFILLGWELSETNTHVLKLSYSIVVFENGIIENINSFMNAVAAWYNFISDGTDPGCD